MSTIIGKGNFLLIDVIMDLPINLDIEAIKKLIEVVSSGIGTLYRPRQIRKEADAEAYAIKVIEKAKAEAAAEKRMIEIETDEQIARRLVAKENRRQENIDCIVEKAAQNLLEEGAISDKPVDVDWATRFFDIVQDVSTEQMKSVWAKILAKEIVRPSSFSLRTLDVLRNISYEEAELFTVISPLVFVQDQISFIFNDKKKFGLIYYNLTKQKEAGLLQSGDGASYTIIASKQVSQVTFRSVCGNKYIELTTDPNTKDIVVPIFLLTQAGRELYELTDHKDNMVYLRDFVAFVKKANPTASIKYGDILERKGYQTKFKLPLIEL